MKRTNGFRWDDRLRGASRGLAESLASNREAGHWTLLKPLLRPHASMLIAAVALNAFAGMAIALQNLAPKWLISDILKPEGLSPRQRLMRALLLAIVYLITAVFARMLVWHLSYRIYSWVRERIVFVLRHAFFRHVNDLCLRFHGRHSSGEMFNYLFGSPINQFIQFYQHTSMHVACAALTVISTLVVVGVWDRWLTLILLATALATVGVMQFSRRRMRALHKDYQTAESEVSSSVADILRGNRAVKLHAMEDSVSDDFERSVQSLGWKSYQRDVKSHIEIMKHESVSYVAYAVLLAAATWRYIGGHVDEGVVAAYLNSFTGVAGPLAVLFNAGTLWGGAQASLDRIGSVLATDSTTPDPVEPSAHPGRGAIAFRDVSFQYEGSHEVVLQDFNLTIRYGEKVALVGPSGAGKSTVSQLILRLYDPDAGSVAVDGIDLRRVAGKELRRLFGVVPQDPFIFRTTIRDNIKVSCPEATDEEIVGACQRANAWEFIARLPHGLDEVVGEGGSSLSGGQRQRLAIARALLADPPYLIFDEATSALDSISEELIQQALARELGDRTSIFIAHRLATLRTCDRIVVLERGRVVQQGNYESLVGQEGLFRRMVEEQRLVQAPET